MRLVSCNPHLPMLVPLGSTVCSHQIWGQVRGPVIIRAGSLLRWCRRWASHSLPALPMALPQTGL